LIRLRLSFPIENLNKNLIVENAIIMYYSNEVVHSIIHEK